MPRVAVKLAFHCISTTAGLPDDQDNTQEPIYLVRMVFSCMPGVFVPLPAEAGIAKVFRHGDTISPDNRPDHTKGRP